MLPAFNLNRLQTSEAPHDGVMAFGILAAGFWGRNPPKYRAAYGHSKSPHV